MRLKEIKPGMVIHCKTKEEMEELSKHLKFFNTVDRIWNYGNDGVRRDCISINDMGQYKSFCTYDYFANEIGCKITEFSDLILPELTAEEVVPILTEICNRYNGNEECEGCPLNGLEHICNGNECPFTFKDYKQVIEICEKWKSDHEKKEPEIETVDICRIIEIQPDGRKRCVHEEDIKPDQDLPFGSEQLAVHEILKRYCMEHDGEFIAVHEVVSRVKR